MAKTILKIDNREHDIINTLNNKHKEIVFKTENLDIGDFIITDENENILIVIERKKYSDLSASIKDGRYKEQKERLIHSLSYKVRKIYLLEGNNMRDFQFTQQTFNSVIINTIIRDEIFVYMSKSIDDTITFIIGVMTNINKYINDLINEIVLNEDKAFNNTFSCKKVKKENVTPEICFRNQLSQIPGISSKISDVFVEKHKNINGFILYLNGIGGVECDTDSKKGLIIDDIANTKYGANMRKIGNKTAEKIYEYIFN